MNGSTSEASCLHGDRTSNPRRTITMPGNAHLNVDYSRRAALYQTRGVTLHAARVSHSPTPRIVTVTIIYSLRLPATTMFKDRAIESVRSTAVGITALWISHNYTQPAIDKWRGRNGSHGTEEPRPPPARKTPKPQERSLYMTVGRGHRCRTLFAMSC